jgi:hypothetical protein
VCHFGRPLLAWLAPSYPSWLSSVTSQTQLTIVLSSAELGSVFFSVREKNFDGRERSAVAKEFSKKAELEMEMAKNRETCVVVFQPAPAARFSRESRI